MKMNEATKTYTCAVCGTAVTEKPCDGLAAEAELALQLKAIGGLMGPTCDSCRAEFLTWTEMEEAT